jgi:hypothetical protein
MKRDRIWPFTELETLILALLVYPFVAFLLGWHLALGTMR